MRLSRATESTSAPPEDGHEGIFEGHGYALGDLLLDLLLFVNGFFLLDVQNWSQEYSRCGPTRAT